MHWGQLLRTSVLSATILSLGLLSACGDDDGGGDGTSDAGDVGDGDGDGDMADPSLGEVPSDTNYCAAVAAWDPAHEQLERDVLEIVNEVRAQGADCGSEGTFDPAPPLSMEGHLRCAARSHSADMVAQDYFDHTAKDGASPGDRVDRTGYVWSTWGENIAAGSPDAAGTMQQWMNSDGHCANIMNPAFEQIGVGYAPGGSYGHVWTQVFGTPR